MSKSAQRLRQGVGVREVCPTFWPTATFLGRYQCLTGSRMVLTSKRQRLRRGHPSPLPACPWLSRPHLSSLPSLPTWRWFSPRGQGPCRVRLELFTCLCDLPRRSLVRLLSPASQPLLGERKILKERISQ